MKLHQLFERKSKMGTYVGVKFSKSTISKLKKLLKELSVPNPTRADKFHCTVIYSRKHAPNVKADGMLDPPKIATAKKFKTFLTQENKNALVVEIDCDYLVDRHNHIMAEYNTSYDFPKYIAHVTLSYDSGDFKIPDIDLKEKLGDLEIIEEYVEDLVLDWKSSDVTERREASDNRI